MKPKRKIIPITDNIKISIKDTRYSVHNNIIICYLYVAVNASLVDDYDRARTFTGQTTCLATDKFDFEKGKRIALAKAELKAYDFVLRYVKNLSCEYKKRVQICDAFEKKATKQIKHNIAYIKELDK